MIPFFIQRLMARSRTSQGIRRIIAQEERTRAKHRLSLCRCKSAGKCLMKQEEALRVMDSAAKELAWRTGFHDGCPILPSVRLRAASGTDSATQPHP